MAMSMHDKHAVAVVSIVRRVPVVPQLCHGNVVAIQLKEASGKVVYLC